MKQTNNAIKFLMAQYRAIFKNANLKMFLAAATAAAAMAAGQAHAQGAAIAEGNFDKIAASEQGYTLDGTTTDPYTKIEISSKKALSNSNAFILNITGGADHSIGSADDTAIVSVTAANAGINISGTGAKLAIGANKSGATVTLGSLAVAEGSLDLSADGATKATKVTAADITLGGAPGKNGTVTVSANATLKATGTGADHGLILKNGGKLNLAGGAVTADQILIEDGAIDATKASKLTGKNVTMKNGSMKATEGLSITATEGGSFQGLGGTITTVADKNLTLKGDFNLAGTTITNGGGTSKVIIEGTASYADGTLVTTATSGATVLNTATADDTSTLNVSSAELAKVMAGGLESSGAGIGVLEISGSGDVNLASTGDGATSILTANDGKFNTKLATKDTSVLKIKGTAGSFTAFDTIDAETKNLALSFGTLTLGKTDNVTVKKAALEIGEDLVVNNSKGLILDSGSSLTLDGTGKTLSTKSIQVGNGSEEGKLVVKSGKWSVSDLTLTKTTADNSKVESGSSLTIDGTLTTTADTKFTVDGSLSTEGAGKFNFKTAAADGSILLGSTGKLIVDANDILEQDGAGKTLDANKYAKNSVKGAGSTIVIKGLQKDQFASKTEFETFYKSTGFDGTFDMGDAVKLEIAEGPIKLGDTVDGLTTDAYKDKTLEVVDGDTLTKNIVVGNVLITGTQNNFDIGAGGKLTLNTADGKGNLITKGEEAVGVNFTDAAATLTLKGAGNIGNIISNGANKGVLNVDAVKGATVSVVKGANIGDKTNTVSEVNVNNGSILNVESGSIFANNLNINDGSTVKVTGDIETTDIQVDGNLEATGALVVSTAGQNNFGAANVKVGSLKLANDVKVNIGHYDVDAPENDATGSVYASSLDLNSGTVFIDPNTNMPYSVLAVNTLKGGVVDDVNAGTLTGTVNVGNNGVFGVGFESTAQLNGYLAKYTNQYGGLDPEQFSSALVLNKQITLGAADGLYVGKDATATSASGNKLTIKSDAALVVSDDAFTVVNGKKTGAAITTQAGATVDVTDAKLVLIGDFSAADDALQIIAGATAFNITGQFKLGSANGLLAGEQTATAGTYKLTFDKDAAIKKGAFADASAPVREVLFGKLAGTLKGDGLGFDLISDVATSTLSGAVADSAAHAATYAGAQQAAVAAVGTMAEAVGGRVGSMGVEAATIAATGSQATGGVWVSPMYKSVDADGFNAQGASYGADIDLAGVAFGADTVDGNSRYGVVFNIGSGESEGKGNGQGLKDDFDYYGIGIYSARAAGNFAVVADASLNVISHDVEGLGLKGSAETMAFTAGLTGQYTMSSPMVDVTPHLGARLIRLDTDSYDLTSADGVVATTDFDVQNVFSVPLGVTLSKAFEMGGWTLAPNADLTIAFNAGDTDAESTTRFSGVNRNIGLTTEVLDEVTYGVAVGLGAQYGSFGTSFGINYTGSENTDALGVNAQARYMF